MSLWALFCCQPVTVSELGSWWLLGTKGMFYEWSVLIEQWALRCNVGLNILHLLSILFCDWDPSKNGDMIIELQCDYYQYNQQKNHNGYNKVLKVIKWLKSGYNQCWSRPTSYDRFWSILHNHFVIDHNFQTFFLMLCLGGLHCFESWPWLLCLSGFLCLEY